MDLERLVVTYGPIAFPVFFVGMWFAVTTLLGFMSGWYVLAAAYPDRDDPPVLRTDWQSGVMGLGVSLRNVLRVEACAYGLRFGIMRIFGFFCRDFFVPWTEMTVTRRNFFLMRMVELRFGGRDFPKVRIPAALADRLAAAVPGRWPELQLPAPQSKGRIVGAIFLQWLASTVLGSAFFILVPRLTSDSVAAPTILAAVVLPALLFGLVAAFQAFRRLTG